MILPKPRLCFCKTLCVMSQEQKTRWKNFVSPFRFGSASTANVSDIRRNICKSKQKRVICGENHSHKGCPKKEAKQPKCANFSGPHVASYKGCPEYKKQAFRQHVVNNQKSYPTVVSQNSLPQPKPHKRFNSQLNSSPNL